MNAKRELPVQVVFRDMAPAPVVQASAIEYGQRLLRFYPRLMNCRVVTAAPEGKHHRKRFYDVRIHLMLPRGNLEVGRGSQRSERHTNIYAALRDGFAAATRQLEDKSRQLSGRVKHHEPQPQGAVKLVRPEESYGIIETPYGDEIYFHANSVVGGAFQRLKPGDKVRYALAPEEVGAGLRASTVHKTGRHLGCAPRSDGCDSHPVDAGRQIPSSLIK
jgi:cold shock CspA family protein